MVCSKYLKIYCSHIPLCLNESYPVLPVVGVPFADYSENVSIFSQSHMISGRNKIVLHGTICDESTGVAYLSFEAYDSESETCNINHHVCTCRCIWCIIYI